MALAMLKYDENGLPKRAKYRFVALGNSDPYVWSKEECFAPVMPQLELQLIVFQAIGEQYIFKTWMSNKPYVSPLSQMTRVTLCNHSQGAL
eukprot:9139206-Ditylum_brightwellii.AAC.1